MPQQQRTDALWHLIGCVMSDAGQDIELIRRSDEFAGALGRNPADRVVCIAPDIQCRHLGWTDRFVAHTARAIPRQSCLHCRWIADDRQMRSDRRRWHTIGGQTGPQPLHVVGQNVRAGIGRQKPLVVPRSFRLLAIRQGHRAVC